jgi:ABC-type multidrug transport system fused ATPase/permease subunit
MSLREIENCRISLYGLAIPLFVLFCTDVFLIWLADNCELLYTIVFLSIETIVVVALIKIAGFCRVREYEGVANDFTKNLIAASRGIVYYSGERLVFEKFDKATDELSSLTNNLIEKTVWKSFFYLALLFCVLLIVYVIQEDYWSVCSVTSGPAFCASLVFYMIFLISLAKYVRIKEVPLESLEPYVKEEQDCSSLKDLSSDNLFIAFHGVYFKTLEEPTAHSAINDLTFSILPGEFLSITGEGMSASSHIFDMLLKYFSPQSGNIYISGTPIKNIKTDSLRTAIGIFKQDFGIIDGTVYDNLSILAKDDKTITDVAEKVGLIDDLGRHVFGNGKTIDVSQATLFKIQAARIAIRQPMILLIESPVFFESEDTEQMFTEFVEYMAHRKTVIMSTVCLKFIIYADKTIYFGRNGAIFGAHASLAKDENYQKYIRGLRIR